MIDPIELSYYTSPMAMGKRKRDRQPTMWVTTTDLPTAASHPFYRRLNQLLREHGFDDFVEAQCAGLYAETMGLPGRVIAPSSVPRSVEPYARSRAAIPPRVESTPRRAWQWWPRARRLLSSSQ